MQIRLAVISNAGGTGKTTLSVHLAYELGLRGLKDDHYGSRPPRLPDPFLRSKSARARTHAIRHNARKLQWLYASLLKAGVPHTNNVTVCQGGMTLTQTADELVLHKRGAYLLGDCLSDYPLEHDLIIFDCPATLGPLPLMALTACTHIIVPVQLEPKSIQGAAHLLRSGTTTIANNYA